MEDREIIKALEYCSQQGFMSNCEKCSMPKGECRYDLMRYTYDLINRQKAEIERLERHTKMHDEIKAEAYKECIDKIQNQIKNNNAISAEWLRGFLDNLLKEIIGE